MLLNAIFCCALAATLAATVAGATLTMARVTMLRTTQRYVIEGYQRAAASLQQTLAAESASGGIPSPLPTFTPIPSACVDASNPCRYIIGERITLTRTTNPQPRAGCDPLENGCIRNAQTNQAVAESRMTAAITVTISTAGGVPLLTRSADAILRTTGAPPYVTVAGAEDGTVDAFAAGALTGDDGGTAPATPSPCASPSPGTAADTEIRVAYVNAATNACSDGSSWTDASYDATPNAPSGWQP